MKKIITAFYVCALVINVLVAYVSSPLALAQTSSGTSNTSSTGCTGSSATICNPLQATSVTTLLTDLVNIAIPIGAVIAVLMYIYVGFKFIFAQGNSDKLKEAREWFIWVSVGTAILIGAKVIVSIMESTLTSAGVVQPGLLPTTTQ